MTSDELKRLTEDGRRLVGEAFLRGETSLAESDLSDYIEPLPGGHTANLSAIDAAVDRVVEEYPLYDESMDRALVEDVHRNLNITRRAAGDPGLWHWLAIVRYPHFVRHRWEYHSEAAMREKFLGAGSDLYSNAIHRLWWIAELTYEDDDYALTETVFLNQTMVNKVFDRWFARYRPAVTALCEELADENSRVIEETTNRFNHALTNVQLEGLDEEETRVIVRRIVSEIGEPAD